MSELRPRSMSQGELAELLKGAGFTACSKTAVSLAERSKETGVQFTPEARKAARNALKSTSEGETAGARCAPLRREENRKNGRKTTVWLDDELREWVETRAYMEDLPVGEYIRRILKEAKDRTWRADVVIGPYEEEKAASDAATSEAAGDVERTDCHGPAGLAMTGTIPSFSDHNTNERRNQA